MKHQFSDTGSTTQRSVAMFLLLLAALFSGNAMFAQNPSYQFAILLGGSGADRAGSVVTDTNGNIYVSGAFTGTVDFDPGSGSATLTSGGTNSTSFLASYDASGAYRWAFTLGTIAPYGPDIALDASGDVVVAGNFVGTADFNPGSGTANLTSSGGSEFVAKYSPTGNYIWAFKIDMGRDGTIPTVTTDANNNIIVSSSFWGTVDFNPGSGTNTLKATKGGFPDIYVAKYNSSGSYLWAFGMGNASAEYSYSIATDASGNIALTGEFSGTVDFNPSNSTANLTASGGSDIFVARYTAAGAYSWAFRVGGTSATSEQGKAVAIDGSGNIVVTGNFLGTADFDPGSGTANLSSSSAGAASDFFVAKYSSSGSYLWAFNPGRNGGNALAIDGSNDIYVTGTFNGPVDFDPGTSTANVIGGGTFVAKYNSSGAYQWAFGIDTTNSRDITVDGSGNVVVIGIFSARTAKDFDPSDGTAYLTGAGGYDVYVAKYNQATLPKRTTFENVNNTTNALRIVAAPNPFTSAFTLRCDGVSASTRVEVVDMIGRVVESIEEVSPGGEIHLGENLPTGAYMVRVIQGEATRQMMVRKVR